MRVTWTIFEVTSWKEDWRSQDLDSKIFSSFFGWVCCVYHVPQPVDVDFLLSAHQIEKITDQPHTSFSCIIDYTPIPFTYTLHNQPLTNTPSHKYLGITLSHNLEFDTHIHNITNRANRTLGFLRRNLHKCTPDIKHVAYNTLVRPTLEYCSAVWDPYTIDNRYKLEQINTRAARFITHNYTQTPGITSQIKKQRNMELLETRRQAHRLTIMYKITNNLIDIQEQEYLQAAHTRITRNSHNKKFLTLSTRTDAYKYSYFPRTICKWNSFPQTQQIQPHQTHS